MAKYTLDQIPKVNVTRDFKSKAPIGTFECSCGFIYARKGPDESSEDCVRIGSVKQFGHVWKWRLKQLAVENLSIRAIARELGVDSKTVKRYLSNSVEINEGASESSQELKYKRDVVEIVQEFPQLSRTMLRAKCKKQYIFLYRHDKEWLFGILPSNRTKQQPTKIIDWSKRDQEYAAKIKRIYKDLIESEKPVRITLSLIGRRLGILANLERHFR